VDWIKDWEGQAAAACFFLELLSTLPIKRMNTMHGGAGKAGGLMIGGQDELDQIQKQLGRGKPWRSKNVDHFETGQPLSMEIGIPLEVKLDILEDRKRSRLVGMDPGNYLIIQMPPLRNKVLEKIFPGSEVTVQYLHQGTVYGFRSSIRGLIFSPARLVFMDYPKMIFFYELRSQKRMECSLPAQLTLDGRVRPCVIRDISAHGCRVLLKASKVERLPILEIDKLLGLRFPLPGFQGEEEVQGKVRNFQTNKHEMSIGVRFLSIDEGTQQRIIDYIDRVEPF
jgi:c-di-GMP-binding flagellar brake protein YcgR